jgi:hypothetical protein
MNIQFEQEVFTYYKEGVMTWIYLNGIDKHEAEGWVPIWQETVSGYTQRRGFLSKRQYADKQEPRKKEAWLAAVAEKSYGSAEMEYWDTG